MTVVVMTDLRFTPIDPNPVIRALHGRGMRIRLIAEATDLTYDVVRARGRRMGLRWYGPETKGPRLGDYYDLTDVEREKRQRAADGRLILALAQAIRRGDHLPTSARDAAVAQRLAA